VKAKIIPPAHRLFLAGLAAAAIVIGAAPAFALTEDGGATGKPDGDYVLGLSFRGRHRAYPLRYFSPPAVVNDRIRQQEVAIFHDGDRGVSRAYFRMVLGEPIEFSGEVKDALADDLSTITRWDMTSGKAVGGNLVGMELIPLNLIRTSWEEWFASHPDTTVFSPEMP
jgi:hypothetical protein